MPTPNGIPLTVRSIDWADDGRGQLVVHVERRADFKAAIAYLDANTVLFDNLGEGHYLALADGAPDEPETFPAEVSIGVTRRERPDGEPSKRMRLANNYLKGSMYVEVVEFDPPSPEGKQGTLCILCATPEAYGDVRKYVDDPHGSALMSMDGSGGSWYVQRVSDDARAEGPFPRNVTVEVRWHTSG